MRMLDTGLKDEGTELAITAQFSEVGVAFQWLHLAMHFIVSDQEIQDEI